MYCTYNIFQTTTKIQFKKVIRYLAKHQRNLSEYISQFLLMN